MSGKAIVRGLAVLLVAGGGVYVATQTEAGQSVVHKIAHSGSRVADPKPAKSKQPTEVDTIISKMSVEAKVGQLFQIRRRDATSSALKRVGGITLFDDDGDLKGSAKTVTARITAAQKVAVGSSSKLPLLVGVDQEYGSVVTRLSGSQVTLFPGSMALGATGDPKLAEAAGKTGGSELRAIGFNTVNAPDADVNLDPRNPVIGARAFGDKPEAVATMTAAAVKGYQEGGVAATIKHFPGHGDTDSDSHDKLPVISGKADTFRANNYPPFQAAIDAKNAASVDMIMVGHLSVPSLDPKYPASQSSKIIDGELRQKLGFKGVVITDAMEMKALNGTSAALSIRAIQAGADIVLMPNDFEAAYKGVLAAVQKGTIKPQTLDAAVTRIVTLKLKLGLKAGVVPKPGPAKLKSGDAANLCATIGARSLTLLGPERRHPLVAAGNRVYVTGADSLANDRLRQAIGATGTAAAHDVTIVTIKENLASQTNQYAAAALPGGPVVAVMTRLPFKLPVVPNWVTVVATYGNQTCSMGALAKALKGQAEFPGKLPVKIN